MNDFALEAPRLAVVATHPIQYQAPLWQAMANSGLLDVKVFYASDHGVAERMDPMFGESFAWDVPLLDGYEYEFLPAVRVPGLAQPVGDQFPKQLVKHLADGGFDGVLIHGYTTGAAWAGYRAARRLGLPILLRGETHLRRSRNAIRAAAKAPLLRRWLRDVTYCLAIGQWNKAYWRHYDMPATRIRTSLYAVDNERFRQAAQDQRPASRALRQEWGIKDEDTVFVYAGKLQYRKGVDVLIEAFKRLFSKRSDVHLVLIGSGAEESELRQKVDGNANVHWSGFVNQYKLPVYYGAADIHVLPSRYEPWGLVVNEAMACGTPCIVSDAVGAGPDLVSEPRTGMVVPVDDSLALADAMETACDAGQRATWRQRIPAVLERASYSDNIRTIAACLTQLRTEQGVA